MKLEDLHPMIEPIAGDIQSCHDRIESLEERLAYAKELLVQPDNINNQFYFDLWDKEMRKFVAKLNKEGL